MEFDLLILEFDLLFFEDLLSLRSIEFGLLFFEFDLLFFEDLLSLRDMEFDLQSSPVAYQHRHPALHHFPVKDFLPGYSDELFLHS